MKKQLVARQILMETCPGLVQGCPSEAHIKAGFRYRQTRRHEKTQLQNENTAQAALT